jgi:hypothetical protein
MVLNNRATRFENLPSALMICYLNGFTEAKEKLITAGSIKVYPPIYLSFKEAMRVVRNEEMILKVKVKKRQNIIQ